MDTVDPNGPTVPSQSQPPAESENQPVVAAHTPRRMPEEVKRHLIRLRDGKLYLPVAARVLWFRDEHPDWSLITEIIEGGYEAGWATLRATVRNAQGDIISTGTKTESKQDFPAGWIEKAETGAIGRALAMAGYGTQFAPELEEAAPSTVQQTAQQPVPGVRTVGAPRRSAAPPSVTWDGPGLCPQCNAPAGKLHATTCALARERPPKHQ